MKVITFAVSSTCFSAWVVSTEGAWRAHSLSHSLDILFDIHSAELRCTFVRDGKIKSA